MKKKSPEQFVSSKTNPNSIMFGYEKFNKKDLILRDHLAIDRTVLANENTLLAYIRTSLAVLIAGLTLLKFFNTIFFNIIAWVLIIGGILIAIIGFYRFNRLSKDLKNIE